MKLRNLLIIFVLSGLLLSCESSGPSDLSIDYRPPYITLGTVASAVSAGDTLRIPMHVTCDHLKSGSIDFGDSSNITLAGLHSVLDTTVFHVFKTLGSFHITISFTNGVQTSKKSLDVEVSDTPPLVTLVTNKSILVVGDTLVAILHASDPTLSYGSIDFKDGTVVSFVNLGKVLDTTIAHVYTTLGSYPITATFSDGYVSTTAGPAIVHAEKYLQISFPVGTEWRFSYSCSYIVPPSMIAFTQSGTHQWSVLSSVLSDEDTILTIEQVRNDTRNDIQNNKTYPIIDTTTFTFTISYDSAEFSWPTITTGMEHIQFANHAYVPNYPLNITSGSGASSECDDRGPISYAYSYQTIYSISLNESFTLVDFIRP